MKLKKLLLSSMLVATATVTLASCTAKKKPVPTEDITTPTEVPPTESQTSEVIPAEKNIIEKLEELDLSEAIETLEGWLAENYLHVYGDNKEYDSNGKLEYESNGDYYAYYNHLIKIAGEESYNTWDNDVQIREKNTLTRIQNAIFEAYKKDKKENTEEQSKEYSDFNEEITDPGIASYAKDVLYYILTHDILDELKKSDINKYKNAALEMIKPYLAIDEATNLPYIDVDSITGEVTNTISLDTLLDIFAKLQAKGFLTLDVNQANLTVKFKLDQDAIVNYLVEKEEANATIGEVISDIFGSEFIENLTELLSESNVESINKTTALVISIISSIVDLPVDAENLEFDAAAILEAFNQPLVVGDVAAILDLVELEFGNTAEGAFDFYAKFPILGDEIVDFALTASYNPQTKGFNAKFGPALLDEDTNKYYVVDEAAIAAVQLSYATEDSAGYVWEFECVSPTLLALIGSITNIPYFENSKALKLTYSKYEAEGIPVGPTLAALDNPELLVVKSRFLYDTDIYTVRVVNEDDSEATICDFVIEHTDDGEVYWLDLFDGMFMAEITNNSVDVSIRAEQNINIGLTYNDGPTDDYSYEQSIVYTQTVYNGSNLVQDITVVAFKDENKIGVDVTNVSSEDKTTNTLVTLETIENGIEFNSAVTNTIKTSSGYTTSVDTTNAALVYEDSTISFDLVSKHDDVKGQEIAVDAKLADKQLIISYKDYYSSGKLSEDSYYLIEIANESEALTAIEEKIDDRIEEFGTTGTAYSFAELYDNTSLNRSFEFGYSSVTPNLSYEKGVLKATGSRGYTYYVGSSRYDYVIAFEGEFSDETIREYTAKAYKDGKINVRLDIKPSITVATLYDNAEFDSSKHYKFAYDYAEKKVYIVNQDKETVAEYDGSVDKVLLEVLMDDFANYAEDIKEKLVGYASSNELSVIFSGYPLVVLA